jgi:hypothetical protein
MEEHDLWIDVRNRRLVWPEERSQQEEITEKMNVPVPIQILQRPKATSGQEEDARRRDALLEVEIETEKRRKNVIPSPPLIKQPPPPPSRRRKHVQFDRPY